MNVSHGATKPDKIPYLQELMQLRKHIIVYSSVPAAPGAQKGTAGHSQTSAFAADSENSKIIWIRNKRCPVVFFFFIGIFLKSLPKLIPNISAFRCLQIRWNWTNRFRQFLALIKSQNISERMFFSMVSFRFWKILTFQGLTQCQKRSQSSLRDTRLRAAAYSLRLFILNWIF